MPSKTSLSKGPLFSKAIFLQNWSSYAPIPIVYFIIVFIMVPMEIYMWDNEIMDKVTMFNSVVNYGKLGAYFGLSSSFFMGCMVAIMVFRYLYLARSSNMVHSLPISREALFVTNYLTGISFLLVPNVVLFVLSILASSIQGIFLPEAFVAFYGIQTALYLFFFTFAVWCAAFTGALGAVAIYYLIFNFVVLFVGVLLEPLFDLYYIGFTGDSVNTAIVQLLTPFSALLRGAGISVVDALGEKVNTTTPYDEYQFVMNEPRILVAYLLVAAVMLVMSLYLYRQRHLETAGEAVSVNWMKPIFRLSLGTIGGVSVGLLTWALGMSHLSNEEVLVVVPLLSMLWGVVFAFVAEMILQKSFRVWQHWKRALLSGLSVAMMFAVLYFDLFGYEQKIPQYEQVGGLAIHNVYTYPRDTAGESLVLSQYAGTLSPALYETLSQLHMSSLEVAKAVRENGIQEGGKARGLFLTYHQNNGFETSRYYEIQTGMGEWEDVLLSVHNDPSYLEGVYCLGDVDLDMLYGVSFYGIYNKESDAFHSDIGLDSMGVSQGKLQEMNYALYAALEEDLAQGNLGKHYLSKVDEEFLHQGYYTQIVLTWGPGENKNPDALDVFEEGSSPTKKVRIALTPQAENTLAVLEAYGVLGEYQLKTNYEALRYYRDWYVSDKQENAWKVMYITFNTEDPDLDDPLEYTSIF